jgi:ATP-dependent RNA helicase RhlE
MFNNRVKPYRSFGSSPAGNSYGQSRPSFGGGRFGGRNRFARRQSSLIGQDINMFIKKASSETIENPTYIPHNSFADFHIANSLKENISGKGYTQPTPIQDQAIEPIMQGRDLIGLANTGTGKTAAFLIPIIDKIFKNRNEKALIIAPTRELAVQIDEEFRAFSRNMRLYSALVIGGANTQRQIHIIRRNPHIVVGTPGRLKDLIERRVLHLEDFSIFVLDEVDLMVDIGFIQDVKYFVSLLPQVRQSLFFSATINPKVRDILEDFVKDPVTISVKQGSTSDNVDQDVIRVISREKKIEQLHDVLIKDGFEKVLIFGRTKHSVDKLNNELTYRGFKTGAIHGNKSQGQRRRVLDSFKQNQIQVLLATDVASRGLDIPDVTHVINYELPESYDDYVHRIGRTGRANKKGIALTFID